jgi:transcriptional regulator with XRE-family HTH domain
MAPNGTAARKRDAASIRGVFGENLKALMSGRQVAEVCRAIGVNRTQFNRYRSGEAFPRPDVLDRICRYFDADARILTETWPPAAIEAPLPLPAMSRLIHFSGIQAPGPDRLPRGLYRLVRISAVSTRRALVSLVHVRDDGHGGVTMRNYLDRATFAEYRQQYRRTPPLIRGVFFAAQDRLLMFVTMRQTQSVILVQLFAEAFGMPGRFTGATAPNYWRGEDKSVERRVALFHIDSWSEAMAMRRTGVGPQPLSDLPQQERDFFEA